MSLYEDKYSPEAIADPQRVILVGPPKAGKSTLLLEIANDFKVLWLDLEASKDLLLDNATDEQLKNITYVPIKDTAVNPIAIRGLLSMFKAPCEGYICADHSTWKCPACRSKKDEFEVIDTTKMTAENGWVIVTDSSTQISVSALQNVCKNSNVDLTSSAIDDRVSFAMWGAQGGTLDYLFSLWQNGKWHIATTCHETMGEEKDKTKKLIPTIGTKNYGAMVNKYFSTVLRVYKKGKDHMYSSMSTDSNLTQTGTRRNLDINQEGVTLADFFKPSVEIADKKIKITRRGLKNKSPSSKASSSNAATSGSKPALAKPNMSKFKKPAVPVKP